MAKKRIDVTNAIVDGDEIWMLTANTDILCEFERKSFKLKSYYVIPSKRQVPYAHYTIKKKGDKIYVLPFQDSVMYIVDLDKHCVIPKEIPYAAEFMGAYGKFHIAGCYGNSVLMIGHNIKGMYLYDEIKDEFTVSMEYLGLIENNGISSNSYNSLFSECSIQVEDRLYVPVHRSGLILVVDIQSGNNRIIKVKDGLQLRTIELINGYDDRFLLTTMDDKYVIWSVNDGLIESSSLELLGGDERYYFRAFNVRDTNYYISSCERRIFVENQKSITELYFDYPDNDVFPVGYTQFNVAFKTDVGIFFQRRFDGQMMLLDIGTNEITPIEMVIKDEQYIEMILKAYSQKEHLMLNERNDELNLKDYLLMLYMAML